MNVNTTEFVIPTPKNVAEMRCGLCPPAQSARRELLTPLPAPTVRAGEQ